jgi:L-threonylcarbamoyladenylate synthase
MKTKKFTYRQLDEIAELLKKGQIIAFPTETVYGLGVVYDNEEAFNTLTSVKKRPPDKPFTLMCNSISDIVDYAEIDQRTEIIIDEYMPGPLTIIVPAKQSVPKWVHLNTGKIGIRVSSAQFLQELIMKVGKPLLVPSANVADYPPAKSGEEAFEIFNGLIAGVLLGTSGKGVPSTVIEISDKIKLIRQGAIAFEDILKVVEEEKI